MSKYILKEYGSWSVLAISYLAGLIVSEIVNLKGIISFLSIALIMNSKQAFMVWWREGQRRYLIIFILQILLASSILTALFYGSLVKLLPYISIPLIYLFLLLSAGEHKIYTEISGFAALTLSSLIAKFSVSGNIDFKLYICVAVFFIAGVFKVKVQFRKGLFERALMIIYMALAFFIYHLLGMKVIILLPLADNLIFSVFLYRVKLKAVGWIEVLKGISFLLLMKFYYNPINPFL